MTLLELNNTKKNYKPRETTFYYFCCRSLCASLFVRGGRNGVDEMDEMIGDDDDVSTTTTITTTIDDSYDNGSNLPPTDNDITTTTMTYLYKVKGTNRSHHQQ